MDAEANRGLEEAFLRRGEGEVDGGVYQAGGVSYHANFTVMTQARKHDTFLFLGRYFCIRMFCTQDTCPEVVWGQGGSIYRDGYVDSGLE